MNETRQDTAVPAVTVFGLTKRFGFTSALKGIDLALKQGEFLAIFGPNGAGKTTLLNILATLSTPTTGQARILGHDLTHDGAAIRRAIGVLSHQPFLIPTLTAYENLKFYGQMFDVPSLTQRIEYLLNEVGMLEHRDRLVDTFSRGMQQRIGIARALLHDPRLLLLMSRSPAWISTGLPFLLVLWQHFSATAIRFS